MTESVDGFWSQPQRMPNIKNHLRHHDCTIPESTDSRISTPGQKFARVVESFEWQWMQRHVLSVLVGAPPPKIAAHKLRMKMIKHCLASERIIASVLLLHQCQHQSSCERQQSSLVEIRTTNLDGTLASDTSCDIAAIPDMSKAVPATFMDDWCTKLNEAQNERHWLTSEVLGLYAAAGLNGNVHFLH